MHTLKLCSLFRFMHGLSNYKPRACGRVVKASCGSPRHPSSNLHHTRFLHAWPPELSHSLFSENDLSFFF
ncbi:unnamed protein product [Brassica napus]|uniref:Uncharacterized protein n=3 Tax=Brassica TaxID=3705 RepID=A0A0D3ADZ5_BRAOL|nr:unnamed protein product [Brassica napus]VDD52718.1 unnamed protein product [Brassica oleracea]